jgi:hypothetical protein
VEKQHKLKGIFVQTLQSYKNQCMPSSYFQTQNENCKKLKNKCYLNVKIFEFPNTKSHTLGQGSQLA